MNVLNILPNESIKYAKETQTAEVQDKSSHPLNEDEDPDKHEKSFQEESKKSTCEFCS